jgi:DNA-binding SARP family transcriptional activator
MGCHTGLFPHTARLPVPLLRVAQVFSCLVLLFQVNPAFLTAQNREASRVDSTSPSVAGDLFRDYSLEFDGATAGSAVVVPFHPALNSYAATRQLTLEAWVKPGRVDTAGPIIQKAVGLCKDDWTLALEMALSLGFVAPNSCRGDGGLVVVREGVRAHVWQHIAAVWDGDSMRVFVDGRLKGASAFDGTPTTNEIGVSIGSTNHWDGTSATFRGLIDEVRFSVSARYRTSFVPRTRWEPDSLTVFHFGFDDGRTDTIVDPGSPGLRGVARNVRLSTDAPAGGFTPARADANTIALLSFDGPRLSAPAGTELKAFTRGRFGKGLVVDDPSDALSVPIDGSVLEGLTADCWARVDRLPTRGKLELLAGRTSPDGPSTAWDGAETIWALRIDPLGIPEFDIVDASAEHHILRGPRPVVPGWHHFAGVWLGRKNSLALFVDASCVASSLSSASALASGAEMLAVGVMQEGDSAAVVLDEVRVAKSALLPMTFGVVVPPNSLVTTSSGNGTVLRFTPHPGYPRPYKFRIWRSVEGGPDEEIALTDTTSFADPIPPPGRVRYVVTSLDPLGFESFRSETAIAVVITRQHTWLWMLAIAFAMLAGTVLWMRKFRRRVRVPSGQPAGASRGDGGPSGSPGSSGTMPVEGGTPAAESDVRPGIYLFGPMCVIGAGREDITHLFTGKVKQLLQLLVLRGNGNPGGVRSEELSALVWPEEDLRSAKNSRNVLINRLRHALASVDGSRVVYKRGVWMFECGSGAVCDVLAVKPYLSKGAAVDEADAERVLSFLERGPLLKGESYPWLDPIRSEIHDQAVRCLLQLASTVAAHEPDELTLRIADAVLLFEPLSEDALRIKVRLLIAAGRHASARAAFDRFAREYRDIAGRDYPYLFADLDPAN